LFLICALGVLGAVQLDKYAAAHHLDGHGQHTTITTPATPTPTTTSAERKPS
jgi:hypothetical protein